jgi:hypothetical protein
MTRLLALAGLLCLLSACGGYDPPVQADHDSAKYKTDLEACRASADEQANRIVSARFPVWIIYPLSYPREYHPLVRSCMAGKGYKLQE